MASQTQGFKKMIQSFFDRSLVHEDLENDLHVLGKVYDPAQVEVVDGVASWPTDFVQDVGSRIWLTYRTGFPPIARAEDGPSPMAVSIGTFLRSGTYNDFKTGFTTDAGWGCMIRTSQSVLANLLVILKLGRDWRYDPENLLDHDEIVSWFIDVPSAPFSIHNFVLEGSKIGKKAGEWFGPNAASRSIQNTCNSNFNCGVKVYLSEDGGDIYEDDLFLVLKQDSVFNPTLILCALRLGVDNVNPVYWPSLKHVLSTSQAVGIAGGRERSSLYFLGYQDDYLFYLDPHYPQESLQIKDDEGFVNIENKFDFTTVHTTRLRKLHLNEMDPSMLIGFLIKDEADYEAWKSSMQLSCKLVHFNKTRIIPNFRRSSLIDFDDEGFIDIGEDEEENTTGLVTSELDDSTTEPVMVEEPRFSEPVMIDKNDLSTS